MTGGFIDDDDYTRQVELARAVRQHGMRLIGPNALGLINTDPKTALNASLVPDMPGRGRAGFFCQTGVFGSAIVREASRRGLGVSTFISAGNRADVSANDMLQFWEDDDSTSVVLLYLESIGNPRKFTRIARRLAAVKPVVAARSGRTTQAFPLGHAVRRTHLPVQAIDAMFDQAGVIGVDSLGELLDLAGLLLFQPLPRGPRVAFISDSDALGVLAVDASRSIGLEPVGAVRIAEAAGNVEAHEAMIAQALADPAVDSVVVTHVPPLFGSDDAIQRALINQARNATKPLVAVSLAHPAELLSQTVNQYGMPEHGSVPVFADVESALRAVASVVRYVRWLHQARGSVPDFSDIEPHRAHGIVTEALGTRHAAADSSPLDPVQLAELLASYGIELWPAVRVDSEEAAITAAESVGYPVVLKTTVGRLAHRTDLGGIRLTLENEHSLRTAFLSMSATLPADALGELVIQRMAPPGVSCVATTAEDPLFGPVVSFRLGGVLPDLLGDHAYRIPPMTDEDARALVRAPKAAALLIGGDHDGSVDSAPADLDALAEVVARLGQLADDHPEIAALELNPIIAHPKGIAVLAATGSVAPAQIRTDLEVRRLL